MSFPVGALRARNPRWAGVSLPELLVVIAILALGVMISIPILSTRVQRVRCRAAADQLAASLRAARMVAVTTAQPTAVSIHADPDNRYEWVDSAGTLREIRLPPGARIVAAPGQIQFNPNGSAGAAAAIEIRSSLSGGQEEIWSVRLEISGIPISRRE